MTTIARRVMPATAQTQTFHTIACTQCALLTMHLPPIAAILQPTSCMPCDSPCVCPISPSSSARGTSAATESTATMSTAEDLCIGSWQGGEGAKQSRSSTARCTKQMQGHSQRST